jgi:hypothetical protein
MENDKTYIIAGSGNVAWHLARWLTMHNRNTMICARNAVEAGKIAEVFSIETVSQITDSPGMVVLYALRDDCIAAESTRHNLQKATEIHLSGSLSIDALHTKSRGVIWPVASLVKGEAVSFEKVKWVMQGKLDWQSILPFTTFAEVFSDEDRRKKHLAAVVLNNFVYHLGVLVKAYLDGEELNTFSFLMEQTIEKLKISGDANLQTGPARRGDMQTVKVHLQELEKHPQLREIYQLMSSLIAEAHEQKL